MVDDKKENKISDKDDDNKLVIDDNFLKEYSSNTEVIKFVQTKFSNLPRQGAINLICLILLRRFHINIKQILPKTARFLQYNKSKFNNKNELVEDCVLDLRRSLNGYLAEIGKDMVQYSVDEQKDFEVKIIDGEQCYIIDSMSLYSKARKLVCDEGGTVCFKYNFKTQQQVDIPRNKNTLQRCQIQILSTPVKFDYPIEYEYSCPQCGNKTTKTSYETACSGGKFKCDGVYNYVSGNGEPKSKVCAFFLAPDAEVSTTKDAYYYDIGYEDAEGNKHSVGALSFEKYEPGFYECVLFKIKQPKKTEMFQIMDIKAIKSNKMSFPDKKPGENYLFTLQKKFDGYIKRKTGMEIYGLVPVKVALIVQTLFNVLGFKLVANVQLAGSASTGKSTVLKYYGFLLNSHLNLSTNGLSISIAGLRGTRQTVVLMGREQKIVTTGYLGSYRSIHIDEAGENKELVQNLKTFIYEDNYGYDKAGATGIFNKRTAHINVSENLDFAHLGQYRGAIRKAYKDLNLQFKDMEKPPWNESWDLHLPLYKYDNPYLRKIIRDRRNTYMQGGQWWIDGYDYALHERFPFYFYLVNEKKDNKLSEVVRNNDNQGTISENLELIRVLKSDDLISFFNDLKQYLEGDNDTDMFAKVDNMLDEYGVEADSRIQSFYHNLVKISRIVNKRKKINKEDLDLVKWFIEKTNRKIDVADTIGYDIEGPPNMEQQKEMEMIEDDVKQAEGEIGFGVPEGEF